jgi:hypothetical protein
MLIQYIYRHPPYLDVVSCFGNQKAIIEVSTMVISDDKLLWFIASQNKIKIISAEAM